MSLFEVERLRGPGSRLGNSEVGVTEAVSIRRFSFSFVLSFGDSLRSVSLFVFCWRCCSFNLTLVLSPPRLRRPQASDSFSFAAAINTATASALAAALALSFSSPSCFRAIQPSVDLLSPPWHMPALPRSSSDPPLLPLTLLLLLAYPFFLLLPLLFNPLLLILLLANL